MWNPNVTFRPNISCNSTSMPWYSKRKLKEDVPSELIPPPKILITEEKMVSQLKGIHLSKDYTSHGGTSTSSLAEEGSPITGLDGKQTLPTLVMCDELRALQKTMEPVLPKHIMDRYQRPTNALVLWQPPVGDLGRYLKTFSLENAEDSNDRSTLTATGDIEMNEDDNNNNNANSQDMLGFFTRTI